MRLLLVSFSTLPSDELVITFQMVQSEEDHRSFCYGTSGLSWEEQLGFFSGPYQQKECRIEVKDSSCHWFLKTLIYPVSLDPVKLMKYLNAFYKLMNLKKFNLILFGTIERLTDPLNLQDYLAHENCVIDKQIVTVLARQIAHYLKPKNSLFVTIMDLINPELLENARSAALQQLVEAYKKMPDCQGDALIEQFQYLARKIFMEPYTRLHENHDNVKLADLFANSCFILGKDNRIQIKPNPLSLKVFKEDNLQTSWTYIGKKLGLEFAADCSWIDQAIFLTPQSSALCIKKGIIYDHNWIKKHIRDEYIDKMIIFRLGMFHNTYPGSYLSKDPANLIADDFIKLCKL